MPQLPFRDKGPVEVTWDYGDGIGAKLVLNPTLGSSVLRLTDSVSDVQEEEWGDTVVDSVFMGTVCELDIPMARSTMLQLETLLANAGVAEGSEADITIFRAKAGCAMYENAKQIVLKPLCDNAPTDDKSKWILIYKCHPFREFELGFNRDEQRMHMVKFKVFPSGMSATEGELYQVGVAADGVAD